MVIPFKRAHGSRVRAGLGSTGRGLRSVLPNRSHPGGGEGRGSGPGAAGPPAPPDWRTMALRHGTAGVSRHISTEHHPSRSARPAPAGAGVHVVFHPPLSAASPEAGSTASPSRGVARRGREVRGGVATFIAMSYIVVLNPLVLGYGRTAPGTPWAASASPP
ncbi:hypothetical protein QJS66_15855 [Kocuria rhizophila]|nr:hypothetical protein QJS66_15855 [Kocuria rhizophila]